ncbi:MAG: DUF6691 family protein [Pseudomonadota bacterium]
MKALVALVAGGLFGLGLVCSRMVDPQQVLAFLTLTERWDPTLAFVMGAALFLSSIGYAIARRRERPLFEAAFVDPPRRPIDARLLSGAGLFGVGWGMTGYCPGPAISGVFLLDERALLFFAGYLMTLFVLVYRPQKAPEAV